MLSLLHSLDIHILEIINLSYHNFILDNIALLVTNLGIVYFWLIIICMLFLFDNKKEKSIVKKMIVALIVTFILTQLIKYVVMRPRPYTELSNLVLLSYGTDASFPSGHTSVSTAMSYVLLKEYNSWYFMLIPIIVAISRLYLGVHYPSDVIGGFLLGILSAYFVENYLNFKLFEI